ncbi:outer membrane protein assembly factor BamB family protein [Lutispora thermophila]|uniref:PQQ-like domain-containing protein n=1 Tax=Lutispora thermophila DSM 19022 TaxID=1122184 RepID=A0A1M6BNJ3_9FIRM|nr:PQQ-binding-like beta-propeller repeat protein [Lutispora thermophila]SHI50289.1 PQQ-like domain-containing protein [Lutispora thermophila DSM 19022]
MKKFKLLIIVFIAGILLFKLIPGFGITPTLGMSNHEEEATVEPEDKPITTEPEMEEIIYPFTLSYTEIPGVLTFRGNNFRTAPAFGTVDLEQYTIEKIWNVKAEPKGLWGGGSGWTGQPALVKWSPEVRKIMNIKDKFKEDDNFVEVIIGSLNGKVYFIDLETGEQTREPIDTGSPIKGSVSVDSRGYPLLYVGQGIKENPDFGFRLYNLIDQKMLFLQDGEDEDAPRRWPNFDSSALFSRSEDALYVGGENGLFYKLKLNTTFIPEEKLLTINPEIQKFKYERVDNSTDPEQSTYGIENSPASWQNLIFFVDNGGLVKCIDTDLNEIWTVDNIDDTDATVTLDIENGEPVIYTACEVDKQGSQGITRILKIEGKTGKILWEKQYNAYSVGTSNGGALATNVVGKGHMDHMVIFTLSRTEIKDRGIMVALNKSTGEELWRWKMPTYAWSSPVDIYDSEGNGYIFQALRNGTVCILDGEKGEILGKTTVDSYIEASPSIYNDYVVIATRNGYIHGLKLK